MPNPSLDDLLVYMGAKLMTDKLLCITLAHHIFLNQEQRCELVENDDAKIEVTGINTGVWCRTAIRGTQPIVITDEPSDEILCRYVISSSPSQSDKVVEPLDDGYLISLGKSSVRQKLLDCGKLSLTFQNYSTVEIEGVKYKSVNFVIIKDEDELLQTITGDLSLNVKNN
jgi:hypothetical protein